MRDELEWWVGAKELKPLFVNEDLPSFLKRVFTEYLDTHFISEKESTESLTFNLEHLDTYLRDVDSETNYYFAINLRDRQKEAHQFLKELVHSWCESLRDIHYTSDDYYMMPFTPCDSLNHNYANKLLRVRGLVDAYQDAISVPRMFLFKCDSCGARWSHPTKKTTRCNPFKPKDSCGRKEVDATDYEFSSKVSFSLIERSDKEGQDILPTSIRIYYEIPHTQPKRPLFTKEFFTKEVEALIVLRPIEMKALEFQWVGILRGIREYAVSSLSDERAEHIYSVIRGSKKPFLERLKDIATSCRDSVAFQELVSIVVLLAAIGLNPMGKFPLYMNRGFHVMLAGDPAAGKTHPAKAIRAYIPKVIYSCGRQTIPSMLGATLSTNNPNSPFIIKAGKFQLAHGGCLIIDELDKIQKYTPDQMSGYYPTLGDGEHTLDTGFVSNIRFKYTTDTISIVNYTNVRADKDNKALYTQIGIDAGIMARMHLIMQVKCPYRNDDGTINEEKRDYFGGVQSGRIIPERVYDEAFCKDYGLLVKQYFNPPFSKDAMKAMEDVTKELNQMGIDTQSEVAMRNMEKKPIDPRTMNGVKLISMIIARALFAEETTPEHAYAARDLLYVAMYKDLFQIGFGSKEQLIEFIENEETKKVEKKRLIEQVLDCIPYREPIDMTEAIRCISEKLCASERDVEKCLSILNNNGEIFTKGHYYLKTEGGEP